MGKRRRHAKQRPRSDAECCPSVLQATESDLRPTRLRRVRRRPLSAILCGRGRPAWSAARTLLSTAADRLLRRLGFRARHRVACGGFLCAPRVSRACAAEAPPERISGTSRIFPELNGGTNSTIDSDQTDYVSFWPNRATEWDSTPKRCSRASSLYAPLLGEADGAVAYHNLGLAGSVDHSCDTPVTPVANRLDVMSAYQKLENSEGSRKSQ
jgi:hypothetical protein